MKITLKFSIVIILAAALSACGGNAVTVQEEDLVSVAYTGAAIVSFQRR